VSLQETELTRSSCYEARVTRPAAAAPLHGRIAADACVVGSGYAGNSLILLAAS